MIGPSIPSNVTLPSEEERLQMQENYVRELESESIGPRMSARDYDSAPISVINPQKSAETTEINPLKAESRGQHEEWMSELPPQPDGLSYLQPRQFSRKGTFNIERGDTSDWTTIGAKQQTQTKPVEEKVEYVDVRRLKRQAIQQLRPNVTPETEPTPPIQPVKRMESTKDEPSPAEDSKKEKDWWDETESSSSSLSSSESSPHPKIEESRAKSSKSSKLRHHSRSDDESGHSHKHKSKHHSHHHKSRSSHHHSSKHHHKSSHSKSRKEEKKPAHKSIVPSGGAELTMEEIEMELREDLRRNPMQKASKDGKREVTLFSEEEEAIIRRQPTLQAQHEMRKSLEKMKREAELESVAKTKAQGSSHYAHRFASFNYTEFDHVKEVSDSFTRRNGPGQSGGNSVRFGGGSDPSMGDKFRRGS
ncbi:hypothetical protein BLNAU_18171 [Blattamonas nauphoetae]|uniref:Uncharacterized protein n=1 Tax=Blattamonas nauphoetae TaxID=2049346 RepID=A0ABQ9X7C9_9EUKA|nr:hypothetical protein BLNAU_18171 [Blattamonas nauphoetae]